MKLVIIVALGLIGLGVYFHEDITRAVADASASRGSSGPSVSNSAGSMGRASNNNFGSAGSAIGG